MAGVKKAKAELYKRYPLANILIYNGATILHFALGGVGIILGFSFWGGMNYLLGGLYLVLAFGEMYVLMPFRVCPNCVYYRLDEGVCISGLNVVSAKWAAAGKSEDFTKRAEGLFCPNNLYLASLVLPILVLIPSLIVNFSWGVLVIWVSMIGLLVFRFFVIFPKLACLHCLAKYRCPQAGMMGVRDL